MEAQQNIKTQAKTGVDDVCLTLQYGSQSSKQHWHLFKKPVHGLSYVFNTFSHTCCEDVSCHKTLSQFQCTENHLEEAHSRTLWSSLQGCVLSRYCSLSTPVKSGQIVPIVPYRWSSLQMTYRWLLGSKTRTDWQVNFFHLRNYIRGLKKAFWWARGCVDVCVCACGCVNMCVWASDCCC